MINERTPAVAELVVQILEEEAPANRVQVAVRRLINEGFWWRPIWIALRDGKRPSERQ